MTSPSPLPEPTDPVLVRRRQIARWADLGQRLGYLLYGLAIVLFVVAATTDLPGAIVAAIVVAMVLGSLVLAPAIVVGYGVRAADREDRERAAARQRPSGSAR
jgi:DMSO/TMAO reductase YedYZ heme-binding membrane subunit